MFMANINKYIAYYNNQKMHSNSVAVLEKKLIEIYNTNKANNSVKKQQDCQPQNKNSNNSLTISYSLVQKFTLTIKNILEESFTNLIQFTLTNCDLRTFENFPFLKFLKNLNVSKNSLRGSFQFLVKNRSLKYIDLSNNLIADPKKFDPLRILKDLSIYIKNNPCDNGIETRSKNGISEQLKVLGVKYLDNPMTRKSQKQVKREDNPKPIAPVPSPVNVESRKRPNIEAIIKARRGRKLLQLSLQEDKALSRRAFQPSQQNMSIIRHSRAANINRNQSSQSSSQQQPQQQQQLIASQNRPSDQPSNLQQSVQSQSSNSPNQPKLFRISQLLINHRLGLENLNEQEPEPLHLPDAQPVQHLQSQQKQQEEQQEPINKFNRLQMMQLDNDLFDFLSYEINQNRMRGRARLMRRQMISFDDSGENGVENDEEGEGDGEEDVVDNGDDDENDDDNDENDNGNEENENENQQIDSEEISPLSDDSEQENQF